MSNPPDQPTRVSIANDPLVVRPFRKDAGDDVCSGTVCADCRPPRLLVCKVIPCTCAENGGVDSCWVRYIRGVGLRRFKLTRLETRTKESTHMREYVTIYSHVRNESNSWDFCTNGRL